MALGGTGTLGERMCELTESYAFSIENYIRDRRLLEFKPKKGCDSSCYFFYKYTKTLSTLLIEDIVTPAFLYSRMDGTFSASSLMNEIKIHKPAKEHYIDSLMVANGL